jgi:predicted enzyme related to lactoylglutathione lyase
VKAESNVAPPVSAATFVRYAHRSTDPERARAFYETLFGLPIAVGFAEMAAVSVVRLPERAVANGARPHWLGLVRVADPEHTAERLLAPGASALASVAGADGGPMTVVVRDPFGAMLGLRSVAPTGAAHTVRWHQHHGDDAERARALYADVFGWSPTGVAELGLPIGTNRLAATSVGGSPVAGFASPRVEAGIHPQWLHFFETGDLDRACKAVRAGGGIALDPARTPRGDRLAACDDPLGAAFGLIELGR